MAACFGKLHSFQTEEERVAYLAKDIKSTYAELRTAVDRVEQEVGDEHWKLPKYREMLFHSSLR